MLLIVGASLTAVTLMSKVSVEVNTPSETVIMIVAEPKRFAAGVSVRKRLSPVPLKWILAAGKSVEFEDEADTERLSELVSASLIEKARFDRVWSSSID